MIERSCYQKLDEPVLVWLGLEFRQIACAIGSGAGIAMLSAFALGLGFAGILLGVGVGGGLLGFFRALRRGGPGYVFARLYRLGLMEILPRGLRPRHLLPLPGGGRQGRFHLSPVLGEDREEGSDAARYFGR
jgi:hypothetical protein